MTKRLSTDKQAKKGTEQARAFVEQVTKQRRSDLMKLITGLEDALRHNLGLTDDHLAKNFKLSTGQVEEFKTEGAKLLNSVHSVLRAMREGRNADGYTIAYIFYTWGHLDRLVKLPYFDYGRTRTAGSSIGGRSGGRSKAEQARPRIDERNANILTKAREMKLKNPHMTRNAIAARMAENQMFMTTGESPKPLKQSTYNRVLGKDPHFKK